MKTSQQIKAMRTGLLDWYEREGRTLPWRIRPEDRANGVLADPYEIWLSEIMCQQTSTTAASAYWFKFLDKWPRIQDLATAKRDDILAAWAGLGYYARARNLHTCARLICAEHGGVFPMTEAGLLKLPGIGSYSAAAIAAICYNAPTNVVDGNVERVISRIFRVQEKLPKAKPGIGKLAAALADPNRPGDYAQALMDLGSHICKPKAPKCSICPWQIHCAAYRAGDMTDYPKRKPKAKRPVRYGAVFYVQDNSHIWLRQRPDKGLLGGMMELPGTTWDAVKPDMSAWLSQAPCKRNWQCMDGQIKHVFTHFTLYLTVFTLKTQIHKRSKWEIAAHMDRLEDYALPSVMRKAILHGQG